MTRELWRLSRARWWIPGIITLACLVNISLAYPLCTSMEAPVKYSQSLAFCTAPEYQERGCCSPREDNRTKILFDSMDIGDANCAAIVKQILCAKCDAFSATLFGNMNQEVRKIPFLCTETSNSNLTTSPTTGLNYCQDVWEACASVPMKNSIFAPALLPGTSPAPSTSFNQNLAANDGSLGSVFKSKDQFCAVAGPSAATGDEFCFDGAPFSPPPAPSNFTFPADICVEKVGEDAYLNLVPVPDGSNRAAVSNQAGTVWLATIPEPGKAIVYNISSPFLDISDRVTNQNELGFLGFAFHPNFKNNGRFFVSYNCDKQKWADCGGICACNKDTNCNPSDLRQGQLGGDGGTNPCQYSSIIAEYTVNTSDPNASPLEAEVANPVEVRRIFTMALPYTTHHAGGLLFGPLDSYLYFMMGDGGNTGDPFNFAQNKKSLLGKIMRLDVDNLPSATQITDQGLWGEYTAPRDNPFFGQNGSRPEIWALGLRNPWRCSFDTQYPTYMYCGDVGQERVEEVNLISKGGNYGWRMYEGNVTYVPPLSPGGNTSTKSVQPIFPILEYLHSQTNNPGGVGAITGGYVSYSREDPCLYGKYVYADLYGTMWAAAEVPRFSGNFESSKFNYLCSATSPLNCSFHDTDSSSLDIQNVLSFGLDNSANFYILTTNGVYRVVHPQNCNRVCTATLPALPPIGSPTPSSTPSTPGVSSPAPAPAQDSAYSSRSHLHISLVITIAVGSVLSSIL